MKNSTKAMRNLVSAGIGRVFLSRNLTPACSCLKDEEYWQIGLYGVVKQSPRDFIVQEVSHFIHVGSMVSYVDVRRGRPTDATSLQAQRRVAEITDLDTIPKLPSNMSNQSQCEIVNINQAQIETNKIQESTDCLTKEFDVDVMQDPHHHQQSLRRYFEKAYSIDGKEEPDDKQAYCKQLLADMTKLEESALLDLSQPGEYIPPINNDKNHLSAQEKTHSYDDLVWIPPFLASNYCTDKTLRGQCHILIRLAYPLLFSSLEDRNGEKWIKVKVDKIFFQLKPWLMPPVALTLQQLYLFKNRGVLSPKNNFNSRQHSLPEQEFALKLHPEKCQSKDVRKTVHKIISMSFRDFDTSTSVVGDKDQPQVQIVIKWSREAHRKSLKRKRKQEMSESDQGSLMYTLAVLQKTNLEHLACLQTLCRILKCTASDIGVAGMKDMCAVTSQFITFREFSPRRIQRHKMLLQKEGIQLGNFEYTPTPLNTGNLSRNKFTITLRDLESVHFDKDSMDVERPTPTSVQSYLDHSVARIQENGFINFFGEQRVGDADIEKIGGIRPVDIGRAMLQGDYLKAIDLIIQGRHAATKEQEVSTNEDELYESNEVRAARQLWISSGRNAAEVLRALPLKGLNRERSILRGAKRYGLDDPLKVLNCLPYAARTFYIHAYQSYIWNLAVTKRIELFGNKVLIGDLHACGGDMSSVNIVDESNQALISFSNLVLPLPGHSVIYPTNIIGDIYKELLDNDGTNLSKSNYFASVAKGGYRFIQGLVYDLKWEWLDSNEDGSKSESNHDVDTLATAKISFELDTGSYATMMLRELMKM